MRRDREMVVLFTVVVIWGYAVPWQWTGFSDQRQALGLDQGPARTVRPSRGAHRAGYPGPGVRWASGGARGCGAEGRRTALGRRSCPRSPRRSWREAAGRARLRLYHRPGIVLGWWRLVSTG